MSLRQVYLLLAVVSAIVPYALFVPWLLANGLNIPLFVQNLSANNIAAFFAVDVIISALVLFVFIFAEGRRLGITRLWAPVVGTLLVGVSFSLPLFLYMRQAHLDVAMASR
ncbi:MAG: DUF2834 domain-containing protein [Anaerolineae bacterium]